MKTMENVMKKIRKPILYIKVEKDKTKYTRKQKHKEADNQKDYRL